VPGHAASRAPVLRGRWGVLVTVSMVGMAPTAVAVLAAFDPLTEGIRNLHDSGNPAKLRTPLGHPRRSLGSAQTLNGRPESPVSPSVR
jgi:hypothetical protein